MKSILITGGCGYVGSAICHLLKNDYKITVIDNLINGDKFLLPPKVNFIKSNINDIRNLKKKLREKYEFVIHCAAYVDAESDELPNKYIKNNYLDAKRFLNFCISIGIKKIIFSSTCAVYAKTKLKVHENSKIRPVSVYGKSKLKLENYLKNISKKKKLIIAF